jgi:hypothetical protein
MSGLFSRGGQDEKKHFEDAHLKPPEGETEHSSGGFLAGWLLLKVVSSTHCRVLSTAISYYAGG